MKRYRGGCVPVCYTPTLDIDPSSGDLTRAIVPDATTLASMITDHESNQGCIPRSAARPLSKFYLVVGTSAGQLSQENSVSRSVGLA